MVSKCNKTRDNAINYLRGISIIYVVIHHSFSMPVSQELQWMEQVLQRFTSEGTTLFILISGYLFYYLLDSYEYLDYLKKKIENVLSPYLLVSIPAVLIYALSFKVEHAWLDMDKFSELSIIMKTLYLYFTGAHLGPFWYVPVIIMVFICSPLTILLLRFTNPLFLSTLCLIFSYFIPRPPSNSNVLMSFGHFYPIFILGAVLYISRDYWLSKFNNTAFLSFIVALYVFLLFSSAFGVSIPHYLDKILIFLVFYYFLQPNDGSSQFKSLKKILNVLAVYSFPIYFVHGYFIAISRYLWGDVIWSSGVEYILFGLSVFIITIIASIFCISIVAVLFTADSNKVIGLNYKEYLKVDSAYPLLLRVKKRAD